VVEAPRVFKQQMVLWFDSDLAFFAAGQLDLFGKGRSQLASVEPPKRRFFRAGGLLAVSLVKSNMRMNRCITIFLVY
jgi:hypothetical protein